jgi:hypothetical protein
MTPQKLPPWKCGSLFAMTSAFTCRVRLLLDAIVEYLNDIFLEIWRAREGINHGFALLVRVLLVG